MTTIQSASLDTNTGKGLLRKIVRHKSTWGDEWTLHAGESTGWKVVFTRKTRGELGDPDTEVVVETDSVVRQQGRTGTVRAFHDSEEVVVPQTRGVGLWHSDTATVAEFLLDGWSLQVTHSAGSAHSSQEGIAFAYLSLVKGLKEVEIGGHTTYVRGQQVCSGACRS
jgi:hypothetical protein